MVKCLSKMRETWVRSLGWEDSLEKEMTTHSSTLALKISWMEELGAGYCSWSHKESGMTEQLHLWRYGLAVDCCRGRGSGCSRLGYGISHTPLGGGRH